MFGLQNQDENRITHSHGMKNIMFGCSTRIE